jgi:hypothetical protein
MSNLHKRKHIISDVTYKNLISKLKLQLPSLGDSNQREDYMTK